MVKVLKCSLHKLKSFLGKKSIPKYIVDGKRSKFHQNYPLGTLAKYFLFSSSYSGYYKTL